MLMENGDSRQQTKNSTLHLLHRAGQCADELFTVNIGSVEITPRQFEVLRAIDENEEPSQTQLVAKTGIDRSTLADIVRRLVQRGLVERQRTQRDARTYAVRLSPDGRGILNDAYPAVDRTNSEVLAAIPLADRDIFIRSLKNIVTAIEARQNDSKKT